VRLLTFINYEFRIENCCLKIFFIKKEEFYNMKTYVLTTRNYKTIHCVIFNKNAMSLREFETMSYLETLLLNQSNNKLLQEE
jgi:hypothetical protein